MRWRWRSRYAPKSSISSKVSVEASSARGAGSCGPRPANPAELLTSPKFQEVLAELKGLFDFVIVDTPPVLAVTDPSAVAPRVDGVLLVFRMTKSARPAAERAREQLGAVGARMLGVVVNAAAARSAGYAGYGYAYQYDYVYSDDYAHSDIYAYSDLYAYSDSDVHAHAYGDIYAYAYAYANAYWDSGCLPTDAGLLEKSS